MTVATRSVRPSYMPKYWPVDKNCVLYLEGQQDPRSATVKDLSGYNNHGTITGATWVRLSSGLWVLSFDGIDDSVNCGSGVALDSIGNTGDYQFSVVCWVKPDTTGEFAAGRIVSKEVADTTGLNLVTADTQAGQFNVIVGASYKQATVSNNSVPFGVWTLLAGVYDGANVKICVNGGSFTVGSALTGAIGDHSAVSLMLGVRSDGAVHCDSDIGLSRLFSRALSATEIAGIYASERHLFGV